MVFGAVIAMRGMLVIVAGLLGSSSPWMGVQKVRPLEGLEHLLSILHSDAKRQVPRNYEGFCVWDGVARRPKTASDEWNAGKMRARICRLEA